MINFGKAALTAARDSVRDRSGREAHALTGILVRCSERTTSKGDLSEMHLENMLSLARMGASIFPPVPAFYAKPSTIEDKADHVVAMVLDQFGAAVPGTRRWAGAGAARGLVKQASVY